MRFLLLLGLLSVEARLCGRIVGTAWDGARRGDNLVRLALGFALWAGTVSAGTYLSARLGLFGAGSWAGHALVAAALLLVARGMTREPPTTAPRSPTDPARSPAPWAQRLLVVATVVAVSAALAGALLHVLRNPHGGYDAWWMWNTKARLLHLHEGPWSSFVAVAAGLGHPDYPLLLPGTVAAGLDLCGMDTVAIPIGIGAAFAIATFLLVGGVIRAERSRALACVACVSLCGYHRFLASAFDQTADVPLALYLAGGMALLQRGLVTHRRGTIALGGLLLGAATWTKNEGFLALAAIAVAGAAGLARQAGRRATLQTLALVVAGATPFLVLTMSWKVSVPVGNDLVGAWRDGATSNLVDPTRYPIVLQAFATTLVRWSTGAVLALGVLVAASRRSRPLDPATSRAWHWNLVAVAIVVMGYGLVFVTTPADQKWHLETALPRLLSQVWPAFVMLCLLRIDEHLLIPSRRRGDGQ